MGLCGSKSPHFFVEVPSKVHPDKIIRHKYQPQRKSLAYQDSFMAEDFNHKDFPMIAQKEMFDNIVAEFQSPDNSKTGKLHVEIVHKSLNKLFNTIFSKKFVQKIGQFCDKDLDGLLSFREFVDIICMINSKYAFDKKVMYRCKESNHIYYKIDYEWAKEKHRYFGASGNGYLIVDEFLKSYKTIYNQSINLGLVQNWKHMINRDFEEKQIETFRKFQVSDIGLDLNAYLEALGYIMENYCAENYLSCNYEFKEVSLQELTCKSPQF